MEFYKEGRVLTIAPNATLDLGAAQYNHKGAIIVSDGATATTTVTLKFFTKGTKSTGASFTHASYVGGEASISSFTNNLIPVRLAEIKNDDATASLTVTLFN
jgi:hypothetical protein